MNAVLLFAVFAVPVGWGFGAWLYTHCRDRRRMTRAFRHGRLPVPHLPQPRPVEAWPVFIAIAEDRNAA